MIIAIDGPAASGKGTLGKRLAAHYSLRHLDTGLIYRAVAKTLLDAGHSPENRARAVAADSRFRWMISPSKWRMTEPFEEIMTVRGESPT